MTISDAGTLALTALYTFMMSLGTTEIQEFCGSNAFSFYPGDCHFGKFAFYVNVIGSKPQTPNNKY